MTKELSSRFNFQEIDEKWSKRWEETGVFHAEAKPGKKPYTIVIPPPNVTGILHMGHALNNTLQDITIRYKRMKGFSTLWMPGTDHAGIATQNVVEKQLAKEGKRRQDLGREEFLKRLWAWQGQYGDTIIHQLKKLGSSCDWSRTRFTMDDEYSHAVKYTFVELHKKGLIYRGTRIINWCPRCLTALSDEEAEHRESTGKLHYIQYPLKDNPQKHIVVATTRPETMLGDTAVAVNPKDDRYKNFIGKTLILPLMNREIPVIADSFVSPEFGTGAVKVTPAHDPNDFEMGQRHNLPSINVMHPDGRINEQGGAFNNLDRFKAREMIIEKLTQKGLLVKIEPHQNSVGHCYRCDTIVEPYLSKQWFVRMKPLADPALKAVIENRVCFYPERWSKVYINWMENIRDWCISRQIWWGHRIPVWYCDKNCEPIVAMETPHSCPHCGSKNLRQDEDVLDTWFSSWLWPFATLDWPMKNKDLNYFYPTSSLFTAAEIIFFWVARMIMAGIEFMGDVPFSEVYIHGTVRDAKGRKMSKSLGNAIDPLEIIKEYGADALRFSLIINSGQDLFISKEKFEIGRNFANKMWNASRLILMNLKNYDRSFTLEKIAQTPNLNLPSRWIISKFHTTLENVEQAVEKYRFSEAETHIYDFFWGNFCDWYLEIIKDRFDDKLTQNLALQILKESLKMVHPFMPFVTEEIFTHLPDSQGMLCVETWSTFSSGLQSKSTEEDMQIILDLVSAIRNIRAQWNIKVQEKLPCHLVCTQAKIGDVLKSNENILKSLAKLDTIHLEKKISQTKNVATALVGQIQCAIPLKGLIDIEKEKGKLSSDLEAQQKALQTLAGRLSNTSFTEKAPQDVIAKDKERLELLKLKIRELEKMIATLN